MDNMVDDLKRKRNELNERIGVAKDKRARIIKEQRDVEDEIQRLERAFTGLHYLINEYGG